MLEVPLCRALGPHQPSGILMAAGAYYVTRACAVGIATAYVESEAMRELLSRIDKHSNGFNQYCARTAHRKKQTARRYARAALPSDSLARPATTGMSIRDIRVKVRLATARLDRAK